MDRFSARRLNPAEALYADYLARVRHGEPADLEELCRLHAGAAGELRELHRQHERLLRLSGAAEERPAAGPDSFAARLVERYGSGIDPKVTLEGPEAQPAGSGAILERLASHAPASARYQLRGEIARGGMGAILRVWDQDLRRKLAMKVILGKATVGAETPPVDRRLLARFLEEAQVTGQLDHPGIVPVHELGIDSAGRVFFTMKLVRGRDLRQVFELLFTGQEGWNETRALGVMLKACEAVAYAHAKGVIHRDLKPANIMVGSFGEVYVMDWGLARVIGRGDAHDLRLQGSSSLASVRTERRDERAEEPDSPLFTMDGDVVGTPAYMPPEQARGEVEKLSPRSDVYSIGAMLYHLLSREMPYVPAGARLSNRQVLSRVIDGPPRRLSEVRAIPAELVAIVERAMARDPAQRYGDTLALAEDLRAYLEHRVVKAYRTGALVELRKWIQRNRGLAGASAAAVLALVLGLGASSTLYVRARENEQLANQEARRARAVQDFLTDSLRAANPTEGNPADYRMRDWLDSVASRLGGSFADQAHVRASLEWVLASCYQGLQDYWSGYLLARKALADLERDELDDPRARGQILIALGESAIGILQDPDAPEELAEEALSALDEAIQLMRDSGGDWAMEISAIEGSIAYLKTRSDRSELWPEPVVQYIAAVWGETDLARVRRELEDRYHAFDALWAAGRREEAKELLRKDGREQSERFGSRGTIAEFLRRMGLVAQHRQRFTLAEACYEVALEFLPENEAAEAVRTSLRLETARLYREVGRLDEAQPVLEALLPELRRLLGPAHEETCVAVRLLADCHARVGRLEEALEELQRLREMVVDELGPETSELALTLHSMADILERAGRSDEALGCLREASAVPAGTSWAERVEHVRLLIAIGRALAGRAELEAAQEHLERAWAELRDVAPLPGALAAECERALSDVRQARDRSARESR